MNDTPKPDAASAPPPRVLVVDDEPQIRKFLDISLRAQGYRVELAANGAAGLAALAAHGAELVILDLGLPDLDGMEVLAELRRWSQVPVLILTVRSGEEQKVALLDTGANDYVTKPFGIEELMARVRALLRAQTMSDEGPVFDDGHLHLDLNRREVRIDGKSVILARKEFALLALLLRYGGRVVTQPHILRELWGPDHEHDTQYLRVLVGKLRQKLNDDAANPVYIATEPGVGLRFLQQNRG